MCRSTGTLHDFDPPVVHSGCCRSVDGGALPRRGKARRRSTTLDRATPPAPHAERVALRQAGHGEPERDTPVLQVELNHPAHFTCEECK